MKTHAKNFLKSFTSNGVFSIKPLRDSSQKSYLEKLPGGTIIDKRLYGELAKSNPDNVIVYWNTFSGVPGFVFVVSEEGEEKLFASGEPGSTEISWIQNGKSYTFNLYEDADKRKPVARLSLIKSSNELRQSTINIR